MTDIPATIWRTQDGLTDTVYTGITYIVDELGNNLADPNNDLIVDTGLTMPLVPKTVWKENEF